MSNLGRWDALYAGVTTPAPYGDELTYRLGAELLASCRTVEDWGCGRGWFRAFLGAGQTYTGVDGSCSPFADRVVDLETYRSDADGVFLRHVLEHNLAWRTILDNAVASFRQRLVIVLFTPLDDKQTERAVCGQTGAPDLSLPRQDFFERLVPLHVRWREVRSATHYGAETVIWVTRYPNRA